MQHKTIETPRGTVHYWAGGQGTECIVFTHGLTIDHGLWEAQAAHFGQQYRVIVWDVPHHGLSRPYEGFSLKDMAEALAKIMEAEGVGAAHLVGLSMGGYISQEFAALYPRKVLSITAVDTTPLGEEYYSALDRWALRQTPRLLSIFPYKLLVESIARNVSVTQHGKQYVRDTLRGMTKEEIACLSRKLFSDFLARKDKLRLQVPVLVVYGERESTGRVKKYSEEWAKSEGYPLEAIPNAAHISAKDNPEGFNHVLEEFLASVRGGPTSKE